MVNAELKSIIQPLTFGPVVKHEVQYRLLERIGTVFFLSSTTLLCVLRNTATVGDRFFYLWFSLLKEKNVRLSWGINEVNGHLDQVDKKK